MIAVVAVTTATILIGLYGVRVARTTSDFFVASRTVPPLWNASAISGEYLSAASFLGVAGLVMKYGVDMMWFPVGYAAGYLVLLLFVAAPLRRSGAYTIPDFAEGRLDSKTARRAATAFVLLIGWFYLLPQMKGAGVTLSVLIDTPYWVGVVVVGGVITANVALGGMRGITFVQAFQYWVKVTAIALPAVVMLIHYRGDELPEIAAPAPPVFAETTDVDFASAVDIQVEQPVTVVADGRVDGVVVDGRVTLDVGEHRVADDTHLVFPAGAAAPHASGLSISDGLRWSRPFGPIGDDRSHPLFFTYSLILATFLGTMGLPHILVRFYTNPDGRAARRTTVIVLGLMGCFYVFPAIYGALGRVYAPDLYVTGRTDAVVLVLPERVVGGFPGELLAGLVAAGAFAAFLSTASGLLISVAGALSHDLLRSTVGDFRRSAAFGGVVAIAARPVGAELRHQPVGRLGVRHRGVVVLPAARARDLVAGADRARCARRPRHRRWSGVAGHHRHDVRRRRQRLARVATGPARRVVGAAGVHHDGGGVAADVSASAGRRRPQDAQAAHARTARPERRRQALKPRRHTRDHPLITSVPTVLAPVGR